MGLLSQLKVWGKEKLFASAVNAEFQNIYQHLTPDYIEDASVDDAAMTATRDPCPGGVLSKPSNLRQELQGLRYLIRSITGRTTWPEAPVRSLADLTITAVPADLSASGLDEVQMTAGENVAFGDICYVKSDGKLWKGKGDALGTSLTCFVALATINANATGTFGYGKGFLRNDTWTWTVGGALYLSAATAGVLTQTAPAATDNAVQIVGIAMHANRIFYHPTLFVYTRS